MISTVTITVAWRRRWAMRAVLRAWLPLYRLAARIDERLAIRLEPAIAATANRAGGAYVVRMESSA